MHTWKIKGDRQNVWWNDIEQKIDYSEHELLNIDCFTPLHLQ